MFLSDLSETRTTYLTQARGNWYDQGDDGKVWKEHGEKPLVVHQSQEVEMFDGCDGGQTCAETECEEQSPSEKGITWRSEM